MSANVRVCEHVADDWERKNRWEAQRSGQGLVKRGHRAFPLSAADAPASGGLLNGDDLPFELEHRRTLAWLKRRGYRFSPPLVR
jgi:hypothetical protein